MLAVSWQSESDSVVSFCRSGSQPSDVSDIGSPNRSNSDEVSVMHRFISPDWRFLLDVGRFKICKYLQYNFERGCQRCHVARDRASRYGARTGFYWRGQFSSPFCPSGSSEVLARVLTVPEQVKIGRSCPIGRGPNVHFHCGYQHRGDALLRRTGPRATGQG